MADKDLRICLFNQIISSDTWETFSKLSAAGDLLISVAVTQQRLELASVGLMRFGRSHRHRDGKHPMFLVGLGPWVVKTEIRVAFIQTDDLDLRSLNL